MYGAWGRGLRRRRISCQRIGADGQRDGFRTPRRPSRRNVCRRFGGSKTRHTSELDLVRGTLLLAPADSSRLIAFSPGFSGSFPIMRLYRMYPMDPASLACRVETGRSPRRVRLQVKAFLTAGLGLLALSAQAQAPDLEIGVRSKVAEGTPKWNKEMTEAEGGHDMVYADPGDQAGRECGAAREAGGREAGGEHFDGYAGRERLPGIPARGKAGHSDHGQLRPGRDDESLPPRHGRGGWRGVHRISGELAAHARRTPRLRLLD